MEALTINELFDMCERMKKRGYGEKKILMAGDEEGNYYHGLYSGFYFEPSYINGIINDGLVDGPVKPEEVVVLE